MKRKSNVDLPSIAHFCQGHQWNSECTITTTSSNFFIITKTSSNLFIIITRTSRELTCAAKNTIFPEGLMRVVRIGFSPLTDGTLQDLLSHGRIILSAYAPIVVFRMCFLYGCYGAWHQCFSGSCHSGQHCLYRCTSATLRDDEPLNQKVNL